MPGGQAHSDRLYDSRHLSRGLGLGVGIPARGFEVQESIYQSEVDIENIGRNASLS